MNVPELVLDDLTWADLVDLARRAIPAASEGQWTLHAPVDPGVTLLELFAAELEQRLYVLDRVPDTLVRAVMRLLLGHAAGPRPALPALTVLSLMSDAGPIALPMGSELTQAAEGRHDRLVLTTEHTTVVVPGAAVTGFEVAGTDLWPRLLGGEPVAVFGADGRSETILEIRADAPAAEYRLYVAVEEPTVVRGWLPGTEPPPPPGRLAATQPHGLGWFTDGGCPVFLDQEGQPLAARDRGALALPEEHALRWEALVGDQRWRLLVEDGTAGLRVSGIVRLRPPPDRTFPATLRVQVSRPSPDTPLHPWVSSVTPNAIVARHRRLVRHEEVAVEPLLPLPHREIVLEDAAPHADQPLDRVLDGPGLASLTVRQVDGAEETWSAVDDLAFSSPEDRHLRVDRARGVLRFGDGSAGRIPRWNQSASVLRTYWLGAGTPPEVGPGVAFEATAAVRARTVTRLTWGQEPESVEAARARAAQQLSRTTRGVTAADVEAIARDLPGVRVARVHVELGLDLQHIGVTVTDAVTVVCVPVVQRRAPADLRAIPAPDLDDWSRTALAAALEGSRLVGSLLTVRGPAYRRVDVAAALAVVPGDATVVLRRAEFALRQFLDPLVGGSRADGWTFGAPLHPADLSAVLQRSLGRRGEVTAVQVADTGSGEWTDCDPLPLRSYELPLLEHVTLTRSSPSRR